MNWLWYSLIITVWEFFSLQFLMNDCYKTLLAWTAVVSRRILPLVTVTHQRRSEKKCHVNLGLIRQTSFIAIFQKKTNVKSVWIYSCTPRRKKGLGHIMLSITSTFCSLEEIFEWFINRAVHKRNSSTRALKLWQFVFMIVILKCIFHWFTSSLYWPTFSVAMTMVA